MLAKIEKDDSDSDSLFILPLSIIPLQMTGLRRMRVIKNSRMEGVVEIFAGDSTGRGMVAPQQLHKLYNSGGKRNADIETIQSLSALPSYDVYSLRLELRRLGIDVDQHEHLRLSPEKAAQLNIYMQEFTRPLIRAVYGEGFQEADDLSDLMKMFLDPDLARARQNLNRLSAALGIRVIDIPKFLDDYGDIYLSLAYYSACLNRIEPMTKNLLTSLTEIRRDRRCRVNGHLMRACSQIESRLKSSQASVASMLGVFKARTEDMWDDISAESFHEIRDLITSYQVRIGSSLCALTVKTNAWSLMFPVYSSSGLGERAKFILSDMIPGIEYVQDVPLSDKA